jgi:hypothetical protein
MLPVFGVGDRGATDAPDDEGVEMTAAATGVRPLVVSADRVT